MYVHKHKPEVDAFVLDVIVVAVTGGAAVGITGVVWSAVDGNNGLNVFASPLAINS